MLLCGPKMTEPDIILVLAQLGNFNSDKENILSNVNVRNDTPLIYKPT